MMMSLGSDEHAAMPSGRLAHVQNSPEKREKSEAAVEAVPARSGSSGTNAMKLFDTTKLMARS